MPMQMAQKVWSVFALPAQAATLRNEVSEQQLQMHEQGLS